MRVCSMAKASQGNLFGGDWTETKLEIVRRYISVYTTALKYQPFQRLYIDAFAGTGERTAKTNTEGPLLEGLPEDLGEMKKGSARVALEIDPPFHRYLLIEWNSRKSKILANLRAEFPDREIDVITDDANAAIKSICGRYDWQKHRAFLFLDPFGLQVDWETLVAVAKTRAIDTWVLFPSGLGLGRMLTKTGDIPQSWQDRLDRALGTKEWRTEFYTVCEEKDLLGTRATVVREVNTAKVEAFYLRRLKSIFADVAPTGVPLVNSKGTVMYLLCFAVGNPRAATLAVRFAQMAMKR
jgi:three-Cys-motif partner protein